MKTILPLLAALAFVGCSSEETAPELEPIVEPVPTVETSAPEMAPELPTTDSTMGETPMMEGETTTDTTAAM